MKNDYYCMQIEAVEIFVLHKLESELPHHLTYHNLQHTKNVLRYAKELAVGEGISGEEMDILLTAAVLHDTGYIETEKGHEEASCRLAQKILPRYNYTEEQIGRVCKIIMATKWPQQPKTLLDEIICDADLYYLGTSHYAAGSEALYHELQHNGATTTRKEWMEAQSAFLSTHKFFTATAKEKLAKKQQQNLESLKDITMPVKELKHDGFKLGDMMLIVAGVVIAGFALKGFLVPNNFFDGGITGISLLIHEIYDVNLAVVILIANLPLIIISKYAISNHFAIKTLFCIILLGVCFQFIHYPVITSDLLLVSIFGGVFLGIGIGLTMRAGCALDGIEVLALYTWRKTSFTISEIIMALNIIIFSIAAFKFGIPTALYSILTYFTASRTVDYVVEGIEAYTGVTIISGKSEIIKDRLVNELGRGITIYKGERGYLPGKFDVHEDCDIIFTIITRLELRKLKNLVSEVDHNAFVFANTIRETSGGIIKRRHMH